MVRAAAIIVPALVMTGADPAPARAQTAEIERAEAIRDTLTRPPAERGTTAGDILSIPFDVLAFPLEASIWTLSRVVGFVGEEGRWEALSRAYRTTLRAGFRPSLSSELGSRSGLGVSLGYVGLAPLRLDAGVTQRAYQRYAVSLEHGFDDRRLRVGGSFRRQTEELFWGIGIDTPSFARADFGRDIWRVDAGLSDDFDSGFRVDLAGAWERVEIDEGGDDSRVDLLDRFSADEAPGSRRTTDLLSFEADLGFRDPALDRLRPRGLRVAAGWSEYRGAMDADPDFRQFRVEAGGSVGVTATQRLVISARGRTTDGAEGEVPFYHLPSLGGDTSLRAFTDGRFRDRASLDGTAEWRWELYRDLRDRARIEAVGFWDWGTVGPELSEFGSIEEGWGFGLEALLEGGSRLFGYVAFGDDGTRVSGRVDLGAL